MKLAFIAHGVHRHGGMERAATEVLERIGRKHEVVVIAIDCEAEAERLSWLPVSVRPRPHLSLVWTFTPKASRAERQANCSLTATIGAAARDADVIVAQFCHAAYSARYGHLRGRGNRLRQLYQQFAERVYIGAERRAYTSPRLKRVIAVSEGTKRELASYYGVPESKFVVIPNGADSSVFKPAGSAEEKQALRRALSLPADQFLALFVGGDWERKGLADGIRALQGLPGVTYVIVGRGDVEAFRAVAVEAGVESQVIFAGVSPKPQDYFAAADAFVFPSRYEAFSLVTLEAAAAGLPIIALSINGTEELIEDGVNGFFVAGDDLPGRIREKLQLLISDDALRARMSQAALESSRRYTWDKIADEQQAVFEDVSAEMKGQGARLADSMPTGV